MTFVNAAFLSEYHAHFTYLTVGLPEDKSFNDFKEDWLAVRKNVNLDENSLDDSLKLLEDLGYILVELPIYEFFENDLESIE